MTTSGADGIEASPRRCRAIGLAVERWGAEGGGGSRRPDLPWRGTRDPWAVLVSEVMAQQTQVARVVPAYGEFLARFPDPETCASAPLGQVIRCWRGLGFNRRARDLHRAAACIVTEHGGAVPSTLDSLLTLPGIGAYTARAVLAFAFEQECGVVDTNAGRVLARAVAGRSVKPSEAQATVDLMVPFGRSWSFNQALLDLGATVCTAADPSCGSCPIRRRCRWTASGRVAPDPAKGSAGSSAAQARFAGSDRQGRGRLIDALRRGAIAPDDVGPAAGWPGDPDRAEAIAEGLITEGLIARDRAGRLRLP